MTLLRALHSNSVRRLAAALITLAMLAIVMPAQAHGYIVRAIPENGARLERSPARVQYWFSEDLEPDFSRLIVRNADGAEIASGGVASNNDTLLTARLPTGLPDGVYIVELRIAFASDGHLIVETRTFGVGAAASAGAASSDAAVPLEAAWRGALLIGLTLLVGVFGVYRLVLLPAWGSDKHPAGGLPPRVMNRLTAIAVAVLIIAAIANAAALIQQTMVLFDADAGRVLTDGLWQTVRVGTRFGEMWSARMALLAVIGALLFASQRFKRDNPETVRAFWNAGAWGAALVVGTMSASSHAAGSPILPWIALFSDWLHALAVGFWAGGVAALALVLPTALQPYTGDARRQALLAAMRRFSPLAVVTLTIVVATGIYNAANWFGAPDDVTTSYGGSLALKLVLMAALVGVGALHQVALHPVRWQRWSAIAGRITNRAPTLAIESAIAVTVLLAVGVLTATPPPEPNLPPPPPPLNAAETNGDLTIAMTITPGGPGVNTYDVTVTRGGAPADGLSVGMMAADPALDRRGGWLPLEPIGDGVYTAVGPDLDRAGAWWTTLDVRGDVNSVNGTTGGTGSDPAANVNSVNPTRTAFTWTIREENAIRQTRDPGLVNLIALVGVIGAVGLAIAPSVSRYRRQLDFSPANLAVGAVGIAATIAVVIGAGVLSAQDQAAYAARINPPPAIVNPTPPDSVSIGRGGRWLTACGWSDTSALDELVRRLHDTRDEVLYRAIGDGWRDLPACAAIASDDDARWDAVNAIRALAVPPF